MTRDHSIIDPTGTVGDALCGRDSASPVASDWDETGRSLRELYAGVVAQPLPPAFVALLSRLDASEGERAAAR